MAELARHLPPGLSAAERESALTALREMDVTLTSMSAWLDERGEQRAAALLDESWQRLAEAGWVLLNAGGLEPARRSPNGRAAAF